MGLLFNKSKLICRLVCFIKPTQYSEAWANRELENPVESAYITAQYQLKVYSSNLAMSGTGHCSPVRVLHLSVVYSGRGAAEPAQAASRMFSSSRFAPTSSNDVEIM